MKRLVLISIISVAAVFTIWSQDIRGNMSAPFVSHLNAESNGEEVILTWHDAPDAGDAVYEIHRYHNSINASNLDLSDIIAVVAPGIRTFTDKPEAGIDWWYALVTVMDGKPVNVLIPWRNSLGAAIAVDASVKEIQKAAKVLSLSATSEGSSVILQYAADTPGREIMILRSSSAFDNADVIDHAVVVGSGMEMSGVIKDDPLPGLAWHYAGLDKVFLSAGTIDWLNAAAFSGPVTVAIAGSKGSATSVMRPAPLPLLRITRSSVDGRPIPGMDGEIPDRLPLGPQAVQALAKVVGPMEGQVWTAPEPDILSADQGSSDNRRQQLLKEIIDSSFSEGDWDVAEAELFTLSAANGLDGATKARIQYYRGQCAYFLDDLSSAFLDFLSASEYYYPQSRNWMERIYRDITPVG